MKEVQWPRPMVWPPESATTSVAVKFLVAKDVRRAEVLLDGGGRLARVAAVVAKLRESRRPTGTS